jgi:hypothetical protein
MMIQIECVMCGKEEEIPIPLDTVDPHKSLKNLIEERRGWVTQLNGHNFDVYCSKRCAS